MAALNEANVLGLELERVLPRVRALFDREDAFFSSIEKRDVEVISSRDMRIPLEMRPGSNFGHYDPDGGDLGRGDAPVFDKATISAVHFKTGVEWTRKSEWSTDDSRKAVLKSFRHLMAVSLAEFKRNLDSACMTSGNGVLATSSAVSAGGGTGGGDLWTLNASGDGFQARLLRFNMTVAVYNSGLTTKRGEAKINFFDAANNQVSTLPAIAGVTAGDKLLISGLSGSSPTSLFGVPYHHTNSSSGTWLGFTRSTTPEIRANRVNAGSTDYSLPYARRAVNLIGNRVGMEMMKGQKLAAWMHPCQVQQIEGLAQQVSVIHKQNKEEGADLYFNDSMQIAGCPIRKSYSWDKTRIDFVNGEYWGRAELTPLDYYEVEGKRVFPIYGSSGGLATALIFYLKTSFNLFHKLPAAGSYIDALTVPTGYNS